MKNVKKWFTLVELIVVVSILAILATIGFVSYSSYLIGVRDTNRTTQITSIYNWLDLYKIKKDIPLPEDSINIETASWTIAYQWYMGKSNLEMIEYSKEWKDPKDDTYFTYFLTEDRKYFQLMAFLEDEESLSTATVLKNIVPQTYAAIDYTNRFPVVVGKKLGILVDEDNNPVQEVETSPFVLTSATGTYKAYFSNDDIIEGTGAAFGFMTNHIVNAEWLILDSCASLVSKKPSLEWKDGEYLILDGSGSVTSTGCIF